MIIVPYALMSGGIFPNIASFLGFRYLAAFYILLLSTRDSFYYSFLYYRIGS